MTASRRLNHIAFAALIGALIVGWQWPWGLLFIYWVIPAWQTGEAHLLGPVERDRDPVLFWAIVTLWTLFGVLLVLADLAPGFTATYIL